MSFLQHEGKVDVLGSGAHVDVAVLRRHGQVVEGQAEPQQAAQHTHLTSTLELKAP